MTTVWAAEQALICIWAEAVVYRAVSTEIHCSKGFCQQWIWLPQFSIDVELPVFEWKKSYLMERKSCLSFFSWSASYTDPSDRERIVLCRGGDECNSRWWGGPQLHLQSSIQAEGHLCTLAPTGYAKKPPITLQRVINQVKFCISVTLCDEELRLITSRFVSVDPKSLYDLFGMFFGHAPQLVLDNDWIPQG